MTSKKLERQLLRRGTFVGPVTREMIVLTQESCYGEVKQTIAPTRERARRLAALKWRAIDYPLVTYEGVRSYPWENR